MKKYALFAAAALVALAACSKNEVKPQTPETPVDDDSPVAVQFGVGAPSASVSTKATGSVGDIAGVNNVWNSQSLYIMGFDRSMTDFTNAASTDPEQTGRAFIWNVMATAPSGVESGVINVYNPDANNDGTTDTPPSTEPFYYQGKTVYDFYGYHVDDAWATVDAGTYTPSAQPVAPKVEQNRIYVPFVITGAQDLMIAKANPAEDVKKATETIAEENAYSAYAARRGVQPNLLFEHQLARFKFEIVPGAESANDVQVNLIELASRTSGNLVVVGENRGIKDVVTTGDPTYLKLQEKTQEGTLQPMTPAEPEAWVGEKEKEDQATKAVGESIMVIPGEEIYKLRLTLGFRNQDTQTPVKPQEFDVLASTLVNEGGTSTGATTFEAGKSYKVTIVIYGLEDVEITATLDDWKDGGSSILDPDQPPVDPDAGGSGQGN